MGISAGLYLSPGVQEQKAQQLAAAREEKKWLAEQKAEAEREEKKRKAEAKAPMRSAPATAKNYSEEQFQRIMMMLNVPTMRKMKDRSKEAVKDALVEALTTSKMKAFDTAFGLKYRTINQSTNPKIFAGKILDHLSL